MKTTFSISNRGVFLPFVAGGLATVFGWTACLFAGNNVSIMASNRLISSPMNKRQTVASTFNDCQGDRCVKSNLVTTYLPHIDFIPNTEKAQMSLVVDAGINASSIITAADDVRIFATSYTVVSGQKSIFVEHNGATALPAQASAATTMDIYDVKVKPFFPMTWLILAGAWDAAEASKPEMEAAANLMATTKVAAEIEQQAQDQMQKMDPRSLFSAISNVAVRDRFLQGLSFSTTAQYLMMEGDFQFGTPSIIVPPIDTPARMLAPQTDIGVQIHQNALNGAAKILGGAVVTGQDVVRWFSLDSDAYLADASLNSLRVTMAQENPLVFSLRDDVATVALSFSTAELSGNSLGAISVQFAYGVSLVNGSVQLELVQGPVISKGVSEPSPSDLPIPPAMVEEVMRVLNAVLHKQLTLGSVEDLSFLSLPEGSVPEGSVPEGEVGKKLVFSEIGFEHGWLNGGLTYGLH